MYGLRIPGLESQAGPDWSVVLAYDHSVRKEAIRGILYEGMHFQEAMMRARTNTELRELHFVAPTMAAIFARGRRGAPPPSAPAAKRTKRDKERSAGKGNKGSGKGSKGKNGKSGKSIWHSTTADGTAICYAYNSQGERCDGKCGRVHCCQVYLGQHPAYRHGAGSSSSTPAE